MDRSKMRCLGLLCALVLVAPGCDSNNDVLAPPSQLSEENVESFVQEVVAPALDLLDLTEMLGVAAALGGPGQAIAPGECAPVENTCVSGSADFCLEPQGFEVTFDQCSNGEELLDGSMTFAGDLTSGTVTFDLSVGSAGLAGTFAYSVAGNCVTETLVGFTASSPDSTATLNGSVQYCLTAWPVGSVDIAVSDVSQGSYLFQLELDGTSTALLDVLDVGGSTLLAECSVNLISETAVCQIG